MVHLNSSVAYQEQKESGAVESWRLRVFNVFKWGEIPGHWPVSQYTDREIMDFLTVADASLVKPEITRLKQDGLIRECSKTRCRWTGKTVRMCEWTGHDYFSRGNKKGVGNG